MHIDPQMYNNPQMYIDPGFGSLLLQVLIGFLCAIPIFLKMYWAKVKKFVKREDK